MQYFAGTAGRFPLSDQWLANRPLLSLRQEFEKTPSASLLAAIHGRTRTTKAAAVQVVMVQQFLQRSMLADDVPKPRRVAVCGLLHDFKDFTDRQRPYGTTEYISALERMLDGEGLDAALRLRGDFILTYLTPNGSELLLFRSLTCSHALYYRYTAGALLWATNPLFLFPTGRPGLDDINIEVLPVPAMRLSLAPPTSCFRNMMVLPSGCCVRAAGSTYASMVVDDFAIQDNSKLSLPEASTRLREITRHAVASSLAKQSPSGVALSGGLDSSILCLEAAAVGADVEALHYSFEALPRPLTDRRVARSVAKQFDIALTEVDITPAVQPGGDYLSCHDDCLLPHNVLCAERALAEVASDKARPFYLYWGIFADQLFEGDSLRTLSFHPLSRLSVWRAIPVLLRALVSSDLDRDLALRPFRGLDRPWRGLVPRLRKRVERIGDWLTPWARQRAFEQVTSALDARIDQYDRRVPRGRHSRTAAWAYAALKDSIDSEHNSSIALDIMLPNDVVPVFPFLDRELIEFCLSLAASHKAQLYLDEQISKVIWRYSYADSLPRETVSMRMELDLTLMAEVFVENNLGTVANLLGPESFMQGFGLVDAEGLTRTLADPRQRAQQSGPLLDACSIELWLRRVST